ncbi:SMI1/KNR4 family protein [Mucilaginibacter sp. CAU 1740]|uniref:SMI1/KNR4 family protein n=1 Tax=Mucilaginibacter sp. CAU 1740 TaxID=3140365 RepID=UPI00325BDE1B
MKEILKQISRLTTPECSYSYITEEKIKTGWIGNSPAVADDVKLAEERLGVVLPDDYKKFLLITNGFPAPIDTEPEFEPVNKIDYLKNIDPDLLKIWDKSESEEGLDLPRSILVAGNGQEQQFLLVPPASSDLGAWKYMKFAYWIPGGRYVENLEDYFKYVLKFMQDNPD